MSAPRTARERVREEMTAEILAVARQHVAREGAAALSLRSIARDLEMAPSALYRYFDGRDALLSALILAAYGSLADEAERAAAVVAPEGEGDAARWRAVPRALRTWALAYPHEWGLIFGTPVPGYDAPEETVEPYARIVSALVRPIIEAEAAGRLQTGAHEGAISRELRDAVAPVSDALFPHMPAAKVVLAIQAWSTIVGVISLEVFGHWRNTILNPGAFFEATIRTEADSIGLR
ncbi:MAG: WHG domain-containing protein [Acidimicrobiales bacterium]|jgi:AcrR family transcriptional regulator